MSKRKRERMKQKAIRHMSEEGESRAATMNERQAGLAPDSRSQPAPKPAASSSRPALTEPAHLAGASPEWKKWYKAVSEAIAASR